MYGCFCIFLPIEIIYVDTIGFLLLFHVSAQNFTVMLYRFYKLIKAGDRFSRTYHLNYSNRTLKFTLHLL